MALLFFWVIIFIGREELGLKGVITCIVIWFALLFGCRMLGLSLYCFTALQLFFDIILVLIIFGGDVKFRP
jgi:hypothetical protein